MYKEDEILKNGMGAMTTAKNKNFYWVISCKLLFSEMKL